jgi:hypothetical protein
MGNRNMRRSVNNFGILQKSIEIGTIIGGKGYFVDYTAAEGKFQNYLPVVQKMINSFEIINSTTGVHNSTTPLQTDAKWSIAVESIDRFSKA